MRAAALVLVVSLVSPAAMTAVCEISCRQALHHAATAAAPDCHEHGAGQADGPAVSGSTVLCHDEGAPPDATAAGAALAMSAPASVTLAAAVVPDAHAARVIPRHAGARPPDRLSITAQLRI